MLHLQFEFNQNLTDIPVDVPTSAWTVPWPPVPLVTLGLSFYDHPKSR